MTDALARLTTALADRYRLERELEQGGMAAVYADVMSDLRARLVLVALRHEASATW